jgi:hypothetical protein
MTSKREQVRMEREALVATISLKDLAKSIAALTKLAALVHLDDEGHLSINLPPGGSFIVRQGEHLRIALDGAGHIGIFGTEAGMFMEGGGQANLNVAGLHLYSPGNKAGLWLHPDGRIQVIGDIQQDVPD